MPGIDLPTITHAPFTHAFTRLMILALVLALCLLPGCSRVRLAYGAADFLLTRYADDYLGLDSAQLERWEPRLEKALAAHRSNELPHLAGFADALHAAARSGFPAAQTRCLVDAFPELYRRHAQIAVTLASPLLAGLTPAQVKALGERFDKEAAEDRPESGRNLAREQRKRAKRWVDGLEDWTGPLSGAQKAMVAGITDRMPDTTEAIYEYRTRKRDALLALIRSGANEAQIRRFLTAWLVDYRDLPPGLKGAQARLADRIVELLSRLGSSLSPDQTAQLDRRLAQLRDDLMALQKRPHMEPVGC